MQHSTDGEPILIEARNAFKDIGRTVLCIFLSVSASYATTADTVLFRLSRALEQAWSYGDTPRMNSLRAAADSLAALQAYRNNWRIHYCRGYCAAFMGRRLQERDGKRSEQ